MLKNYKYLINTWLTVLTVGPILLCIFLSVYDRAATNLGALVIFAGFVLAFGAILSLPGFLLMSICYKIVIANGLNINAVKILLIVVGLLSFGVTILIYLLNTPMLYSLDLFPFIGLEFMAYAIPLVVSLLKYKVTPNETIVSITYCLKKSALSVTDNSGNNARLINGVTAE